MEGNRKDGGAKEGTLRSAAVVSLGLYLLFSALGGLLLGSYLDRSRGTSYFTPAGLLLGLLVGLHRAYILVKASIRRRKSEET